MFDGVSEETLADTEQLRAWFAAQVDSRKPVLPNSPAAWEICVAAAEQALSGSNPVAWFAKIVGKRDAKAITEAARYRAKERIQKHQRATKLDAPTPAGKGEP